MKYIYMDNVRGFSDSLVELSEVNFCVGENSSGKTSFLILVKLISEAKLWFGSAFGDGELGLHHFQDMVTINSSDKKRFSIGYSFISQKKNNQRSTATLFTFVDRDGEAFVQTVTHKIGRYKLRFVISNKQIRYNISEGSELDESHIVKGLFSKWNEAHCSSEKSGFMVVNEPRFSPPNVPFDAMYNIRFDLQKRNLRAEEVTDMMSNVYGFEMAWLAPIRTEPKRTYDELSMKYSATGQHTPYVIKKLLSNTKNSKFFIAYLKKIWR